MKINKYSSCNVERARIILAAFEEKTTEEVANIVVLHFGPPENDMVFRADEKPHIWALEREQMCLKLPDSKTPVLFTITNAIEQQLCLLLWKHITLLINFEKKCFWYYKL